MMEVGGRIFIDDGLLSVIVTDKGMFMYGWYFWKTFNVFKINSNTPTLYSQF